MRYDVSTLQRKEKGRKTVLAMSSGAAIMSMASAASRDLQEPFGYSDGVMVAYKASKSALNQRAYPCRNQPKANPAPAPASAPPLALILALTL